MAVLHVFFGLSFQHTLLWANLSTVAWLGCYFLLLEQPTTKSTSVEESTSASRASSNARATTDRNLPEVRADSGMERDTEVANLLTGLACI